MEQISVAILGCGTVGGGVAKIINEISTDLNQRAGKEIKLKQIVELNPKLAAERFGLPLIKFDGWILDISHGVRYNCFLSLSTKEYCRLLDGIDQTEGFSSF